MSGRTGQLTEIPTASAWCQRWRDRRPSWCRPEDGGFDPRRYEVHPLAEAAAKAYVLANHYSGTFPAAVHRFGLFDTAEGMPRLAG